MYATCQLFGVLSFHGAMETFVAWKHLIKDSVIVAVAENREMVLNGICGNEVVVYLLKLCS